MYLIYQIMVVMRRYLHRLLRVRNLLTFTIIIMLLYVIKMLSTISVMDPQELLENEIQQAQLRVMKDVDSSLYFVPTSFAVSGSFLIA